MKTKHARVEPITPTHRSVLNKDRPVRVPADKLRKQLQTTLPSLEEEHRTFRQVLENLRKHGNQSHTAGEAIKRASDRVSGGRLSEAEIKLSELDKRDKVRSEMLRAFDNKQTVMSLMNPVNHLRRKGLVKNVTEVRESFNKVAESYNKIVKELNTPQRKEEIKSEAVKLLKSGFGKEVKRERASKELSKVEKEIVNYRIMDRRLEKLKQEPVQIEKRDIRLADKDLKSFRVTEDLRKRLKTPRQERSLKR
jgi:hypothetical protein